MSSSFRELRVWQEGLRLSIETYRATSSFPKHELYGLGQQMRRAAVSVPSNIAEGKGRRSNREFAQFLYHARGSLLELETQIMIAHELHYVSEEVHNELLGTTEKVGRSLTGLINAVEQSEDLPRQRPTTKDQRPSCSNV
jgi:four helix bundle protein